MKEMKKKLTYWMEIIASLAVVAGMFYVLFLR